MATIVCQNLEPQLKESTTLRLKLSAPKPLFSSQSLQLAIKSCFVEPDKDESGSDCGGWAFLTEEKPKEKEVGNYVHPLHKRALSSHSLEMCTENLGSETGSDGGVFEDSDVGESPRTRKPRGRRESGRRDLPPPLTTMSGSECVRIRTHREDGRMVMEAVKGESSQTCFRSERGNGRLRLYIDESCAQNLDRQEEGVEEAEERGVSSDEGRSGSVLEVKGEMGKEGIQRRCKKGGESERKGLMMNWEPVWVAATS